MEKPIRFYFPVLRSFAPDRNSLVSAAVWSCGLCNGTISGMGGPGSGEICEDCGKDLLAGRLRGAVVRGGRE